MPREEMPLPARENLGYDKTFARDMARAGNPEAGRKFLMAGLALAEDAQEQGKSWGTLLIGLYQQAIAQYDRRYGPAKKEEG